MTNPYDVKFTIPSPDYATTLKPHWAHARGDKTAMEKFSHLNYARNIGEQSQGQTERWQMMLKITDPHGKQSRYLKKQAAMLANNARLVRAGKLCPLEAEITRIETLHGDASLPRVKMTVKTRNRTTGEIESTPVYVTKLAYWTDRLRQLNKDIQTDPQGNVNLQSCRPQPKLDSNGNQSRSPRTNEPESTKGPGPLSSYAATTAAKYHWLISNRDNPQAKAKYAAQHRDSPLLHAIPPNKFDQEAFSAKLARFRSEDEKQHSWENPA